MKKLLSLIVLATLSAQNIWATPFDTPSDDVSEKNFSRFASRYDLDMDTPSKEIKHGVPALYFNAARALYNEVRYDGQFQLLDYLFQIMPLEYREAAFSHLNAFCARPPYPSFAEFPGLKERLLGMPFEPAKTFNIIKLGKEPSDSIL